MATRNFKAMQNRKRYIKPWQVQQLIDYFFEKAGSTPHIEGRNINKAYLIFTLWRTGRRVTEVIGDLQHIHRMHGLRPMDLDNEDRTITFSILKKNPVRSKDKYGKARSEEAIKKEKFTKAPVHEAIAYDDSFFNDIHTYIDSLGIEPHERVFPYTRQYVDNFIKRAALDLDLNLGYRTIIDESTGKSITEKMQINIHSLRHGFSIHFLKNNKDNPNALPMLQEILCHSSIGVTKTYLKYDQEDRRKALNKVFGATQ